MIMFMHQTLNAIVHVHSLDLISAPGKLGTVGLPDFGILQFLGRNNLFIYKMQHSGQDTKINHMAIANSNISSSPITFSGQF